MKWEYLSIETTAPSSTEELDAIGCKRWELVSVTSIPGSEGMLPTLLYIFKRPLMEAPPR